MRKRTHGSRWSTGCSTGDSLGCYGTLNSERIPDDLSAPKIVFCYLAQKYDNESIPTFIDAVETGKLRLLEKKEISSYAMTEKEYADMVMPYFQTNCFVEEISNLKLEHLRNGGLSIRQVAKKVNKDRFSSVQYPLWYIMRYLDGEVTASDEDELFFLSQYVSW